MSGILEGWIPPTVEEFYRSDRTILTLSFVEKVAEKVAENSEIALKNGDIGGLKSSGKCRGKTNERKMRIVSYLTENGSAKTKVLSDVLGVGVAMTRRLIAQLVDAGIVKPEGSGRTRYYTLAKRKK